MSIAALVVLVLVGSARSAITTLRPGEFCALAKQGYYEANGYICRIASDGRYRLYTYGGGGSGGTSPPKPPSSVRLGRSIDLRPVSRLSGCRLRHSGELPDASCTPGAYYSGSTVGVICRSGYSARVRKVTDATKQAVYRAYGILQHRRGSYEIDHLVPLELGGSNVRANLFPEPATPTPGYHQKDQLENWAHDQVCAGRRSLRATQRQIAQNWLTLYTLAF